MWQLICHLFLCKLPLRPDFLLVDLQSMKEGKDQESIQSSTTPDQGYQWESDNVTIRHHKQEPRGQPFSRHQQTDVHKSFTKQDRININDPVEIFRKAEKNSRFVFIFYPPTKYYLFLSKKIIYF